MDKKAKKIYELTSQIPLGKISTYKAIADALGTKAYRYIGRILSLNPHSPEVPCHRVVRSDSSISGYMGKLNGKFVLKKVALLNKEGIAIRDKKIVDFGKHFFSEFKIP